MKTVVCYVRVSTENQLENYSIEEQIDRLKAYCKAKDFNIYKIYTDGGYSGGNTNRPALQQMIADVHQHRIDAVVVYKLDRLSRSQKDTLTLIEDTFLANNVDFISVCENFDTTTPFGRAMIGILSVFAQLEKDQITERFTMGRIGRSKSGYFHGGINAPKGYKYIDSNLIVDDYEAMQVKEVFSRFISGESINAISKAMTNQYGQIWNNANKIRNVIKNSVYCGKVKFKGQEYKGQHKAIISDELYKKANFLLTSSKREESKTSAQKTPFRAGYLLSSLVYCKNCGARYSANHGYYKCYSRSKSSKKFMTAPDCKNENWEINKLDELIINEIKELTFGDNLKKLFEKSKAKINNDPDLNIVKKSISDIDTQILRLLDLYQLDKMTVEQIADKISKLQESKNLQLKKLDKLNNLSIKKDHYKEFENTVRKFDSVLDSDISERRLLVSSLIEKIIINGSSVEIQWRL